MSDPLAYTLITAGLRLLGAFPLSRLDAVAQWLGRLWFAIDRRHRKIALKNLGEAFSGEKAPAEIRRLARACFENLSRVIFEIGWSLNRTSEQMRRHVLIQGLSHYRNAVTRKKGVLLLTLHLGNWELLGVVAALAKIQANVLFRPLDVGSLDLFFNRFRSRFGARLIPNARSMRKILKALRRREAVAVLLDQNVDWYEGVFVDFFGKSACTNQGLALLASTTQAPVIPVFLVRKGHRFIAEFSEEIPLVRTGDRRKDLEENTRRYTEALEAAVRRFPDQWLWVHQRWKTRPSQPWPRRGARKKGKIFEAPV